jgi:hypothetical protein
VCGRRRCGRHTHGSVNPDAPGIGASGAAAKQFLRAELADRPHGGDHRQHQVVHLEYLGNRR